MSEMFNLRIEHPVRNYHEWKKVFDNDPANREKSGVHSYSISRPLNNNNYVIIDLLFKRLDKAQNMLETLRKVWNNVEDTLIEQPKTSITELLEKKEY